MMLSILYFNELIQIIKKIAIQNFIQIILVCIIIINYFFIILDKIIDMGILASFSVLLILYRISVVVLQ